MLGAWGVSGLGPSIGGCCSGLGYFFGLVEGEEGGKENNAKTAFSDGMKMIMDVVLVWSLLFSFHSPETPVPLDPLIRSLRVYE